MNRTLISFLDGLNQFLAIIITLAGAGMAWSYAGERIEPIFFKLAVMAVGGIVGFLVAAIVCGFLATLIEIERHLRAMRETPRA